MDPKARSLNSEKIWKRLEATEEFQRASKIACYINFRSEVETLSFLLKHSETKQFYVPRTRGKRMDFLPFNGKESLESGNYGILEPLGEDVLDPKELDLILTPGLAFTPKGGRLGYGGGFYDRFFETCPAFRVGLAFEEQILEELPLDPWDYLLQRVITEERILPT